MKYEFKCSCGHKAMVAAKISEASSLSLTCPNCGATMSRVWGATITVPDYMHEVTDLNRRLKHTTPSGKSKILF